MLAAIDMFSKGYRQITARQEAESQSKNQSVTSSNLAFRRARLFGYSLKQDIDVQLKEDMFPNTNPGDPNLSDISYVAVDVSYRAYQRSLLILLGK